MKIAFVFLSMLAMTLTFWWAARRHDGRSRLSWRDKRRIAVQSLVAGIAVYFFLLLAAALFLTFSNV
ncbi:hypothetical protein [Pusillimonas sp.]|uniref:hypothetical protein n=1 Tax=Pusillimonas sp. TaxID=3040095 RepID=UPI0037C692E0